MTDDGDPNVFKASPDEMLSDDARKKLGLDAEQEAAREGGDYLALQELEEKFDRYTDFETKPEEKQQLMQDIEGSLNLLETSLADPAQRQDALRVMDKFFYRGLQGSITPIIQRNSQILIDSLTKENKDTSHFSTRLLLQIAYGEDNPQAKQIMKVLFEDKVEVIFALASDEKYLLSTGRDIELILRDASDESKQKTIDFLRDQVNSSKSSKVGNQCIRLLSNATYSEDGNVRSRSREEVRLMIAGAGLPLDQIRNTWTKCFGGKPFLAENMSVIYSLEKTKPGTAKQLFEKFGIENFGRYPFELLSQQTEEAANIEKPFGIILYPKTDHNGAFYSERRKFLDFINELMPDGMRFADRYATRVVECESKIDIAKMLIRLNRAYGKLSFAIIGGHGATDSIEFGENDAGKVDQRHQLTIDDLSGQGLQRTGSFFAEGAPLVLLSCSTGAREGIGQQLSQALGVTVLAPDKETTPRSIKPIETESGLRFDVEFDKAEGITFDRGRQR